MSGYAPRDERKDYLGANAPGVLNETKAQKMVARLLSNTCGLRYGSTSVTIKLHEGRITDVFYSTTESMREHEPKEEKANKEG